MTGPFLHTETDAGAATGLRNRLEPAAPGARLAVPMRELWIASNNQKKRLELERLLGPLGITLRLPHELGAPFAPIEDQPDFAGNAHQKAALLAHLARGIALADDSGLCVDALGGEPGGRSARYAGPEAVDARNNALLLERLADVPDPQRTAHFVCAIVLAAPDAVLFAGEGRCDGRIARRPAGRSGFGYDPLFLVPEYGRTFAELGPTVKNRISHRARALAQLRDALERFLISGERQA